MSLFYQQVAIWYHGMCPSCREWTAECEQLDSKTVLTSGWHQYYCTKCETEQKITDAEVELAYYETMHWEEPPLTTQETQKRIDET